MKSSTYKIRDCFAALATTTSGTFYETIRGVGRIDKETQNGLAQVLLYKRVKILKGGKIDEKDLIGTESNRCIDPGCN